MKILHRGFSPVNEKWFFFAPWF